MDLLSELQKRKKITKEQLLDLKIEQTSRGVSIEDLILEKNILSEEELFKIKSEILDIPLKKELPETISSEVLKIFPKDVVEYYKILPFLIDKEKNILQVGMVYPDDVQGMEIIKFLARQEKLKLEIFLITLSTFKKFFPQFVKPEEELKLALEKIGKEISAKKAYVGIKVQDKISAEEAPIIKMVNVIIKEGIEGNASDIHIEPLSDKVRVRYRKDGILYTSLTFPIEILDAIVARIKILANLKIDETRLAQDGRFSMNINDKKIDFRVATYPTILGEKVSLRILDPTQSLKPLEELGFSNFNLEIVKKAIKSPYGMILITGPTGSGKTTTLYAILNKLNREGVNIITLEDPIEYFIDGINQSQIKPEIGWTFFQGLRQILRQDPNIIMIGEIRDRETLDLAINAALTGHLMLSTLHTNNAIGAIPRMIDMGADPYLIPLSLSLVINQKLARLLCPYCKEKIKPDPSVENYISQIIKELPNEAKKEVPKNFEIFKANGCKKCNFTGYSGRIGFFEILKMSDSLAKLILEKAPESDLLIQAKKEGFLTLEEDGILKVVKGLTSFEEFKRIIKEK